MAIIETQYATVVPLALAVFGGVATARLGRAISVREGEAQVLSALIKAVRAHDAQVTRAFWITAFDFAATIAVLLMVALYFFGGPERIDGALLVAMTAIQGGLSVTAYLLSRGTINAGPENGQQPGERIDSRNIAGGRDVSSATAENPMSRKNLLTRQERAQLVELGVKRYQSLRPELERNHKGEYIAISVKTGDFTTTHDDAKLKAFADSLSPDDFLWMTRVGSP